MKNGRTFEFSLFYENAFNLAKAPSIGTFRVGSNFRTAQFLSEKVSRLCCVEEQKVNGRTSYKVGYGLYF